MRPVVRGAGVGTMTAVECSAEVGTAFTQFYEAVFGDLAGYGWQLTGDPHIGDELAQEALTRVYTRFPLLRDPRPYAFRTVTNLARDRWRRQATERAALPSLPHTATVPGPEVAVLDAVERLPAGLRDVVLLYYYADLPVSDVAHALRRPVGTVKRRLSEARALLATALEDSR